ncbi:MAG: methyltransferase domain-containing protein [archaeon]
MDTPVSHSDRSKDSVYWDYWVEMVKASVYRDSRELPAIIDAAQIQGKHVVDAGCGPGRLILPFAKIASTITAVDESDWTRKAVEDLIFEHRLKESVQMVQSPMVGLPFDDGISESTYCMWIIHHAKKRWEKIVHELVRITRPGSPIVIGFASGEKDLPLLEDIVKHNHAQDCHIFDASFPKWIKEQGWSVDVRKVPLAFEFKSPEWAFEVLSNTFLPKKVALVKREELMNFFRSHLKGGKVVIEQELRLYVIRAP